MKTQTLDTKAVSKNGTSPTNGTTPENETGPEDWIRPKNGNLPSSYFRKYLEVAPLSHAMWRAPEAVALSNAEMIHPLLDIGCGFGEFADIFFDCRVEAGIDISASELEEASTRNIYGTLMLADAREVMSFPDETFNTVISVSVLEHINGVERVFGQAYRVLKPGGTMIYTVPTSAINKILVGPRILRKLGLKSLANMYVKKYHQIFKHEVVVPKSEWLKMAEDKGFEIQSVKGTLTAKQIRTFETFLVPAQPSRWLRSRFKRRLLISPKFRVELLSKLFQKTVNDPNYTDANIIVVAKKPARNA